MLYILFFSFALSSICSGFTLFRGLSPLVRSKPSDVSSVCRRSDGCRTVQASMMSLTMLQDDEPSDTSPSDDTDDYFEGGVKDSYDLEGDVLSNPSAATVTALEQSGVGSEVDWVDMYGRWQLVYTNEDDKTRSSPFFHAFRQALDGVKDPMLGEDKALAESIFSFTDAIPFKSVGDAFHTVSSDGELVSEVEVKVELAGSSIMTTRSHWTPFNGNLMEIRVETTQAVQSSLGGLIPFGLLDGSFKFPSGSALELVKPGSSTVLAKVTYLSAALRVVRIKDKVYAWKKV